jgi:hypothetical protein
MDRPDESRAMTIGFTSIETVTRMARPHPEEREPPVLRQAQDEDGSRV